MIKNIIFDIGNVLADFSWKKRMENLGFSEELIERVADATVRSPQWNEWDLGILSSEEIIQLLMKNDSEIADDIYSFCSEFGDLVTKCSYAIPWIEQLKERGYGVYYLSNFSKKAEEECSESLDFIPYMDGGILSWHDKLTKPMPEIYQLLLKRYGLNASECVFLDDTEKNVKAAVKEGLAGIVVTDHEQAVKALEELLAK